MLTWFYGKTEDSAPDEQMVHRPSDSRLLSNLISHEKDYSKHLQSLLESSHASLASLSAFAAANPQPISRVILSIAGDFSGADDAFRRYKDAVDAWREQLGSLKDMESDVANIVRDRDILVTRLLKASKNEKPPKDKDRNNNTSRRSSVMSQSPRIPSESTLSLSADHPSNAPPTSLQTSNKLGNAQAELQACEVHLTAKEKELEIARITAIRDGLRIRCDALIECGQVWVDMGQDALRTSEGLQVDAGGSQNFKQSREPYLAPHTFSSAPHKAFPQHILAETGSEIGHHHSEVSSIGPSQSASQVNMYVDQVASVNPVVIPNAPNPILGANGSDIQCKSPMANAENISGTAHIVRSNSTPPPAISSYGVQSAAPLPRTNTLTNDITSDKPAPGFEYGYSKIQVPPAHAIRDGMMPTVTPTTSKPEATQTGSGYLTPVSNEDLDVKSDARNPDCSKEDRLVKEGKLRVVENPRFHQGHTVPTTQMAPAQEVVVERTEVVTTMDGVHRAEREEVNVVDVREIRQENELPHPNTEPPPGVPASVPTGEPQTPQKRTKRSRSPSPRKSGFLGSLRKVFGGTHRSSGVDQEEKAREKENKVKEKEERRMEKEEKKMGKARERDVKREGRQREQEEKKEEREREKEERARVKQKQKRRQKTERRARLLRPDSSSEDEELDDDSFPSRRAGKTSGFIGVRKKEEKWTSRTDKNISEIQQENVGADSAQGVVRGFVVRQNTDLQKNLRGGIVTAGHVAPFDMHSGRVRVPSDIGGYDPGIDDVEGGRKLRGRRTSTTGASFVVERGAKVSRRSSAPPRPTAPPSYSRPEAIPSAIAPSSTAPFSAPRPSAAPPPLLTETRFWEDLSSRTGSPLKVPPAHKDRGYVSDTGVSTSAAAVGPGSSGGERRPSKMKQASPCDGRENIGGRGKSITSATAPVFGATGPPAAGGGGRRAISVDYGRYDRPSPVTSPRAQHAGASVPLCVVPATPESRQPRESLMNIVDNLTRNNRQAWEFGLIELDRARGATQDEAVNAPLGSARIGNGMKASGSLNAARGITGAGLDVTGTKVNDVNNHGPDGITPGRRPTTGYAVKTGKDGVVPMDVLPSLSLEEQGGLADDGLPPPVVRVGGVQEGVGEYRREGGDDDDSTSTTSYETGHENFESADEETPKKRVSVVDVPATTALAAPVQKREDDNDKGPIAMPSPILYTTPDYTDASPHAAVVLSSSPPRRRKSVRVSLNPTFSPTPPAIEDEQDEYGRAPFVFREPVAVAPPSAPTQGGYHSPSRVPPAVTRVPKTHEMRMSSDSDVWDDDSDTNAEYQRAKRLLMRATRKEKDVMW